MSTTGDADPASGDGEPSLALAVSVLLPFSGGNSNTSLLPTLPASHAPNLLPRYPLSQISAPTQGCTFQLTCKVALPLSLSTPVGSVIWYFGFWFFKESTPG